MWVVYTNEIFGMCCGNLLECGGMETSWDVVVVAVVEVVVMFNDTNVGPRNRRSRGIGSSIREMTLRYAVVEVTERT